MPSVWFVVQEGEHAVQHHQQVEAAGTAGWNCLVNDWAKPWDRLGLAAVSARFSLGWDEAEFGNLMEWVGKMDEGLAGDRRRIPRIFSGSSSIMRIPKPDGCPTYSEQSSPPPIQFQLGSCTVFLDLLMKIPHFSPSC